MESIGVVIRIATAQYLVSSHEATRTPAPAPMPEGDPPLRKNWLRAMLEK